MNDDDVRLENDIRAMFADRSERVRRSSAPYGALLNRIALARRRRRQRVGGSLLAVAVAAAGVGAWASATTVHRSAPLPPSGGSAKSAAPVRFEYADGTPIPDDASGDAAAMREAATTYLASVKQSALAGPGHTVVTTFDRAMMAAAKKAGDARAAQVSQLPSTYRLAFATVDSRTGFVKAFYGGSDALSSQVQVGQLMFPIVLAAALESGTGFTADSKEPATSSRALYYPIGSTKESDHITYVDADGTTRNWPPPNLDQGSASHGATATLAQGVEWSINPVMMDLELDPGVTPLATYAMAKAAGLPDTTQDFDRVPSVGLGFLSTSPARMAAVYAAFADGGVQHDAVTVASVRDAAGHIVWTADTAGKRAMSPSTAAAVTGTLKLAATQGTGKGNQTLAHYAAAHPGVAGKTSTADMGAAWFTGYDGDLVTSVAVFKINVHVDPPAQPPYGSDVQGNGLPATVWAEYAAALRS